ncbi:M48 family metallopeptidase [Candidatus Gottesmanbacteria bacterium]|nr:M48 family metallopeptidase [Candidatus Gottesmanbacteria bacterium]
MAFFTLFIAMVVFILSKASGYGISWVVNALIISGVMSIGSYFWGDKMILAMSGARVADKVKDRNLYQAVEHVARLAKIPMPKVYIMEDQAPNAFATGRDPQHSAVCATRGILEILNQSELEAVFAHEISHIQNYDTRVLAVVTILVGMVAFLSDWFMRMLWWGGDRRDREDRGGIGAILMLVGIVLAILSPIIATVIQLAISRRREFLADASGALITKNPDSLATALEKIAKDRNVLHGATNATAHLFIVNPFKGKDKSAWFSGLFNTHPPVEERIRILHSM